MRSLAIGDSFDSPAITVTEQLRADAVRVGGYTHPLFTRPEEVSLAEGSPVPGQALLMIMGGLVEQSGRVDDAVVLVGIDDVRFRRPAVVGTVVRVRVEVVDEQEHRSGNRLRVMRWTALSNDEVLVASTVRMLVRVD